jgi:hypothetical protein
MPNGLGFRRGGFGFGFRGSSPPWPFVGIGRGGLPRCGYFLGAWGMPGWWYGYVPPYASFYADPHFWGSPYAPQMTREEELEYLKNEAEAMKQELDEINARIRELEGE